MYGCDCDGVTRDPLDVGGGEGVALRSVLTMVGKVAGHRPPTCPWRAFYEPIVREVLAVSWAVDEGNLSAIIGTDPDAKLAEGLGVYRRALTATVNEDKRLAYEEDKRRREHAAASNRGRRG